MSELLLDIKNFSLAFGAQKAIKNISLQLHKGETLAVVGESGSGKSVTSLAVMRLLQSPQVKTQGQIDFYQGARPTNLLALPLSEIRQYRGKQISMIFQEPMTSLNPVYTCGAQVLEVLMLHKPIKKDVAKQEVIQLFEKVELPRPEAIYNSYPHEISGGQKQRVMIAMAIACNPVLLIADEPTTALDVTVQKSILQLLKQLQQELAMGLIFISHDLALVSEIAHRVAVLYKGCLVEEGLVKAIFKNPQHPYTKALLACRPPVNSKPLTLPTVKDFMREDEQGNIVEVARAKKVLSPIAEMQVKLSSEKLFEVKDLSVLYPVKRNFLGKSTAHVSAVNKGSFDIYKGETLGLVGESGCGKSTIGKVLVKLLEPTSGTVLYEGKNLVEQSSSAIKKYRSEVQMVFQDPYSSLNPRHTVGEAILEPMYVHGLYKTSQERRERMKYLLEKVDLTVEQSKRYPHEFSGGQRQRVCIARALAVNPRVIVLDESVAALDVSVQAHVLNLLNQLKREFLLTYVFISHDLTVVKYMADRLLVMNKGIIEESGFSEEVYRNPQSTYTQKLIAAMPQLADVA